MGVTALSDLLNCTSGTKDYSCDCEGRLCAYVCVCARVSGGKLIWLSSLQQQRGGVAQQLRSCCVRCCHVGEVAGSALQHTAGKFHFLPMSCLLSLSLSLLSRDTHMVLASKAEARGRTRTGRWERRGGEGGRQRGWTEMKGTACSDGGGGGGESGLFHAVAAKGRLRSERCADARWHTVVWNLQAAQIKAASKREVTQREELVSHLPQCRCKWAQNDDAMESEVIIKKQQLWQSFKQLHISSCKRKCTKHFCVFTLSFISFLDDSSKITHQATDKQ